MLIERARRQYNGLFRLMANSDRRWHLFRFHGTDNVVLMREDANWGSQLPSIMVRDVHALTEDALVAKIQGVTRLGSALDPAA